MGGSTCFCKAQEQNPTWTLSLSQVTAHKHHNYVLGNSSIPSDFIGIEAIPLHQCRFRFPSSSPSSFRRLSQPLELPQIRPRRRSHRRHCLCRLRLLRFVFLSFHFIIHFHLGLIDKIKWPGIYMLGLLSNHFDLELVLVEDFFLLLEWNMQLTAWTK